MPEPDKGSICKEEEELAACLAKLISEPHRELEGILGTMTDQMLGKLCDRLGAVEGRRRDTTIKRISVCCARLPSKKKTDSPEKEPARVPDEGRSAAEKERKTPRKKAVSIVESYIKTKSIPTEKTPKKKSLIEKIDPNTALARRLSYDQRRCAKGKER